MQGTIFQRIKNNSNIKVVAEPELIEIIQDNGYKILQIVDLLGSRPINVLRYLVEFELMGAKLLQEKLKGQKTKNER